MPYLICGIVSLGLWYMIIKGFSAMAVWFCDGGWYRFIDGYEAVWDKIREPVLYAVGIMIAFFVFYAVIGFVADWRERKR